MKCRCWTKEWAATDGEWSLAGGAENAKAVATPIGVLMKQAGDGFVTKGAAEVEYHRGVLVHRGTQRPFYPDDENRHTARTNRRPQS